MAKHENDTRTKEYLHALYDQLEVVAGHIGRIAADGSMRVDAKQILDDTIMVAEQALTDLERLSAHSIEAKYPFESEETYEIVRRFCYAKRGYFVLPSEIRAHLEVNGVELTYIGDDEIFEYINAVATEIVSDARRIHDATITVVREHDRIAFCEPLPVSDKALVSSEERQKEKLPVEDIAPVDSVDKKEKIEAAPERTHRRIDPEKLLVICLKYLEQNNGSVQQRDMIRYFADHSDIDLEVFQEGVTRLIEQERLFPYRENGSKWVTANREDAAEKRQAFREKRRAVRSEGGVNNERSEIDVALAERVLSVFLAPGTQVDKLLTPKEVWAQLHDDTTKVNGHDIAFGDGERKAIVGIMRRLERCGVARCETRGINRGGKRSAGQQTLKIGLFSQDTKERLIEERRANGSLMPRLKEILTDGDGSRL